VTDQFERLKRLHGSLLGTPPGDMHERLYRAFPTVRGFSSRVTDDHLFEGVLILALLQAGKLEGESHVHKVYFFTPERSEKWVVEEFRSAAKRIFDRLKTGKSVSAIKHVGALFHQVMLGSQILALPAEPERWVAFGFSKFDGVPEWLGEKLLDPAETGGTARPGV
jgi:hypothetical protein